MENQKKMELMNDLDNTKARLLEKLKVE